MPRSEKLNTSAHHTEKAHEAEELSLESDSSHLKSRTSTPNITGIKIVGDSLSDAGRKYREKFFGFIPCRWFLHKSNYGEFTDANVWAVYFEEKLKKLQEDIPRPSRVIEKPLVENEAEGGATLNKYRSFHDFLKRIKSFFMSFFLGSIQDQVDYLKKNNKFTPEDLVINWGGANDLVTLNNMDEDCVERLIKSNQLLIDKVSRPEYQSLWLHKNNHSHEFLIFELPDISCTPRFANKSPEDKAKIALLCESYSEKIKELAKKNKYIDFSNCSIYSVKSEEDLDVIQDQENQEAIVFVGEGKIRQIYFIEKGKYVERDEKRLFVEYALKNKKEQRIFIPNEQKKPIHIKQNRRVKAGHILGEVIAKAGLNANVHTINIAEKFKNILNHPEKYNLTVGCAILYATEPLTKEALAEHSQEKNAIILIPDSQKKNYYNLQIVKEGKFVLEDPLVINLTLTPSQKEWIVKKLSSKSDLKVFPLVSGKGLHDDLATSIIVDSIEAYKKHFKEDLVLTGLYISVLELLKKHYPTEHVIFWDDLHPAESVHKIIAELVLNFFIEHFHLILPESRELEQSLLEEDTSMASSVSSGNYLSNEAKLDTVDINPSKQRQQSASITTAQVFTEQNLENNGSCVCSNSAFFQPPPVQNGGVPKKEEPIVLASAYQPNSPPIGGCFEQKVDSLKNLTHKALQR